MFHNNQLIVNYRFYQFLSSIEIIDLLRCINYRDQIFQARTTRLNFSSPAFVFQIVMLSKWFCQFL